MTEIKVVKTAPKDATYEAFCGEFPEGECRYGVFDTEYTDPKTGGKREKIVFFAWAPDSAPIKQKMLYASSKQALKNKLVGLATELQASDRDELRFEEVVDKINRV